MELSCSSDYLADAKVIKFSFLRGSVARKFLTTSSLRSSEVLFQVSITFWKRSTSMISPLVYFCSVIRISSSAASRSDRFDGGTCRSSTKRQSSALIAELCLRRILRKESDLYRRCCFVVGESN